MTNAAKLHLMFDTNAEVVHPATEEFREIGWPVRITDGLADLVEQGGDDWQTAARDIVERSSDARHQAAMEAITNRVSVARRSFSGLVGGLLWVFEAVVSGDGVNFCLKGESIDGEALEPRRRRAA